MFPCAFEGKGDGMKRSALSLIGSLVGLLYLATLCFELVFTQNPRPYTLEALGFSVQMAALLPSALLAGAAVLLGFIGFGTRKRGPVLAAALLYLETLPLAIEMYAVPLALSLILLADFFASLIRHRRESAGHAKTAPIAEGASPGWTADEGDPMEDPALDADSPLGNSGDMPDDLDDDLGDGLDDDLGDYLGDEPFDDPADDPQLEAVLEDVTSDVDDKKRPGADGMSIFLGIFMGLVVLALVGLVIFSVMGLVR